MAVLSCPVQDCVLCRMGIPPEEWRNIVDYSEEELDELRYQNDRPDTGNPYWP